MLESVDLAATMQRGQYKALRDNLVGRLILLQQAAITNKVPAILVFEGWDGAGKGSRIGDLIVNLDPRAFSVCTAAAPTEDELRYPFMQRFWAETGAYGTMTIFDRSWYSQAFDLLFEQAEGEPAVSKKKAKKIKHEALEAFGMTGGPSKGVESDFEQLAMSMTSFEKQFSDDGYVIVKYFLHISQDEQLKRLKDLEKNADTAWRVTKDDYRENKAYERRLSVIDTVLEKTDFDYAHWHVIPGTDWRLANALILQTLVEAFEKEFVRRGIDLGDAYAKRLAKAEGLADALAAVDAVIAKLPASADSSAAPDASAGLDAGAGAGVDAGSEDGLEPGSDTDSEARQAPMTAEGLIPSFPMAKSPTLDEVSHSLVLDPAAYKAMLEQEQKKLSAYHQTLYRKRIPMMLAYEGWDAAGKGGNIKRVAAALDARDYRIVPSSSPTPVEKEHPFLWRYWTRLPRTGHTAIYDRTWYGRVLVERIEGFATPEQWRRAYGEINDFEWEVVQWGAILLKFWVDVSPDEQLRRFNERAETPEKQWKITDEDWRNRDKYPQYKVAVDDMLRLTSTEHAPWLIVESDDKYYARIKVLKAINAAIEERLEG